MNLDHEVEAALTRLRADPTLRARYDLNGDGQLDEREWALVRRMVEHEIRTARERGTTYSCDFDPEVLNSRYEVVGLLGRGGQASTYLALDREHGNRHVVAKVLEIKVAADWKSIELFEREAQILEQLEHPRIPSHIDHFHYEQGGQMRFVLIQQFINGTDLGERLDRRQTWTTEEAWGRIAEISAVLSYLHDRNPPVLHRDIKPSNLILGEDDELYLVDFGAAQNIVPTTAGGSTIIGTSGYVPMEQYMGRAVPASDIYALGATALHMLSAVHPSDQEFERGQLVTARHVRDPQLRELLDEMLQPHVEDRLSSAAELHRRATRRASSAIERVSQSTDLANATDAGAMRARMVVRAVGERVQYSDPLRPFLRISQDNDSREVVRMIHAVCTVAATNGELKIRMDGARFNRGTITFGTALLTMLLVVTISPWWYALLGVIVIGYFTVGYDTSRLIPTGWRSQSETVPREKIKRFECRSDERIVALDHHDQVVANLAVPPMSRDATEYLVQVLNGQLAAFDGDERFDPRQIW